MLEWAAHQLKLSEAEKQDWCRKWQAHEGPEDPFFGSAGAADRNPAREELPLLSEAEEVRERALLIDLDEAFGDGAGHTGPRSLH